MLRFQSPVTDVMAYNAALLLVAVVDDCQFVCITQADYYKILHEGEDALVKEEEEGRLVKVSEVRRVEDGSKHAKVLLRATPEKLLAQLVEDTSSADLNFIEDFLLCHRIFLDSSLEVVTQLLEWFERPELRDRVTRILLLWVNNHFTDFELDADMMELLDTFETRLEEAKMHGQLRMLNFACAAKARPRSVIITRSSKEEELEFTLIGGYNTLLHTTFGIFIESVTKNSIAARKGLKRGDQILDVNAENFQNLLTLDRAVEFLKKNTHLQINVKSNFLQFKEVTSSRGGKPERSKSTEPKKPSKDGGTEKLSMMAISTSGKVKQKGPRARLKTHILDRLSVFSGRNSQSADGSQVDGAVEGEDNYDQEGAIPEHSLKIYKADQTHRFLLVNKNTTAREVVMLSLKEFGITDCSTDYALFEVSTCRYCVASTCTFAYCT